MKKILILVVLAIGLMSVAKSQSITLRFTGENDDATYIKLDSVVIRNNTRNWEETIYYPDTVLNMPYLTSSIGMEQTAIEFGISAVRPNPFDGVAQFELSMPQAGNVRLQITDINGKFITATDENLNRGICTYEVSLLQPTIYIVRAISELGISTSKLINTGNGGRNSILQIASATAQETELQLKASTENIFELGDEFTYTGYTNIDGQSYTSNVITQIQNVDEDFTMMFEIDLYETIEVNGVSFVMIPVEGGTFSMGSVNGDSDEQPVHQVTLDGYYIGETEVTQELWQAVMGSNPSYFTGNLQRPVERVSWYEVQEFITALNAATGKTFRLPTEAEWEFAARGGNKSKGYLYSGSNTIDDVAWHSYNSGMQTHEVGGKQANELGIYDMSGNVREWCSDWYDSNYYSNSPTSNPTGPETGSARVERGGSWSRHALDCRSAFRNRTNPTIRGLDIGFRVVRVL